jgi:hypothetical protein
MQKKIRDEILGVFVRAFTKKKSQIPDDEEEQENPAIN